MIGTLGVSLLARVIWRSEGGLQCGLYWGGERAILGEGDGDGGRYRRKGARSDWFTDRDRTSFTHVAAMVAPS